MMIMKNHADLLHEIEIIKEQIEQLEISAKHWMGDNLDNGGILILVGEGASKYGLSVASQNVDRIHKKINALQTMLEGFEMIRVKNEKRINRLQGLGYKIAKLRFIEGMSYKEIAEELGYSYGYIKNVAAETKRESEVVTFS